MENWKEEIKELSIQNFKSDYGNDLKKLKSDVAKIVKDCNIKSSRDAINDAIAFFEGTIESVYDLRFYIETKVTLHYLNKLANRKKI